MLKYSIALKRTYDGFYIYFGKIPMLHHKSINGVFRCIPGKCNGSQAPEICYKSREIPEDGCQRKKMIGPKEVRDAHEKDIYNTRIRMFLEPENHRH